jgi:hypothetical protein
VIDPLLHLYIICMQKESRHRNAIDSLFHIVACAHLASLNSSEV